MESTLAAGAVIMSALCAGSLVGLGERSLSEYGYKNFLDNPANYYLVDREGNPVSQEAQ